MKKILNGVIQFKQEASKDQLDHFKKLALGQNPDALFITCSDNRIVPSLFTKTDPGDLFVVRNVGNLIPPVQNNGCSSGGLSEIAALEFSVYHTNIENIIVCGHSECRAMKALLTSTGEEKGHLYQWIKYGQESKRIFEKEKNNYPEKLSDADTLSQINVLQQLRHMETYPFIKEKIKSGKLKLHAWWFDIATASVYFYDKKDKKFKVAGE